MVTDDESYHLQMIYDRVFVNVELWGIKAMQSI